MGFRVCSRILFYFIFLGGRFLVDWIVWKGMGF